MLLLNAEKLVIPVFSSTRSLAYYSVAFALASLLMVIPQAVNLAVLPAFSRIITDADLPQVENLLGGLLRINLLWIVPAILIASTGARFFIGHWAGPTYAENCIGLLYILLIGIFFDAATSIAHVLLQALGRTDLVLRISLVQAVPYLIFVVIATYSLGPVGAAIAWSMRSTAQAILRVWVVRNVSGLSPNVLPLGPAAYIQTIAVLLIPPLLASGMGETVFGVVTSGAIVGHLALVWTRVLTKEDKLKVRGFLLQVSASNRI